MNDNDTRLLATFKEWTKTLNRHKRRAVASMWRKNIPITEIYERLHNV